MVSLKQTITILPILHFYTYDIQKVSYQLLFTRSLATGAKGKAREDQSPGQGPDPEAGQELDLLTDIEKGKSIGN